MIATQAIAPVPGPVGLPVLFGHHVFEATKDGGLSHSIDGVQRAIVPPEGLQDYLSAWPHATDLVAKLRARFTPDQKKRVDDAAKAAKLEADRLAALDAQVIASPIGAPVDAANTPGWAAALIDRVDRLNSQVDQMRTPRPAADASQLTAAQVRAIQDARPADYPPPA